jgi:hypothetical protein
MHKLKGACLSLFSAFSKRFLEVRPQPATRAVSLRALFPGKHTAVTRSVVKRLHIPWLYKAHGTQTVGAGLVIILFALFFVALLSQ